MGRGEAPTAWHTVGEGDSSSAVTDFGAVDLDEVRTALAAYTPPADTGGPTFSAVSPNPFEDEFTVRLIVTGQGDPDARHRPPRLHLGRRPELRAGFPKRLGTGGEAPIRYADINGDNVQELIVPTEDGTVHAYEPDGSELPGWPVHTHGAAPGRGPWLGPGLRGGRAAAPPREAPRGPIVADLDGDGCRR